MKYSSLTTPIGIPLRGLFPNLLYSFLNSDWIAAADYNDDYYKDPCLITAWHSFICGRVYHQSLRRLITSQAKNKLQ